LLSDDQAADRLYREAIERFARTRVRVELARTQLLYGEWLRRERRRLDARVHLRHAHELFTEFGMHAFAERARVELEATGEHAHKRTATTIDQLTPQELQIAQMARDGLSNPEIGARLFISRRTVKYHLQKVFTKLEISSRTELERVLPRTPTV
jgi:DNA-binding NarL/FixJ family response regulator